MKRETVAKSLRDRITNSCLWAAHGDALGFITELADERTVKWRAGVDRIERLQAWRRRIGGQFGTEVQLPAGTYSDDTQLRLATSRAIRGDGEFDVEAFAKVEMPVWLSYGLGGGRGSRAAAANLANDNVNWFANLYKNGRANYFQSGGNGVSMRIQPHVWAARSNVIGEAVLLAIFRNSISTHGHMRAFVGSLFHARCLSHSVREGQIPEPDAWISFLQDIHRLPDLLGRDHGLSGIWLPAWEAGAKTTLLKALEGVVEECKADCSALGEIAKQTDPIEGYRRVLRELNAFDARERGSGTRTAIAAAALAWLRHDDPEQALIDAANALGSDTDSIATMTGALIGATGAGAPSESAIMDVAYLTAEAERLFKLSCGEHTSSFGYPELMAWRPPRNQVECLGEANGGLAVAGLGFVTEEGPSYHARARGLAWQWVKLEFGQTLLIKRRLNIGKLARRNWPVGRQEPVAKDKRITTSAKEFDVEARPMQQEPAQTQLFGAEHQPNANRPHTLDVHRLTDDAIRSGFAPGLIGEHIVRLAESAGIESVIAYAAIIAKAKVARMERRRANES